MPPGPEPVRDSPPPTLKNENKAKIEINVTAETRTCCETERRVMLDGMLAWTGRREERTAADDEEGRN